MVSKCASTEQVFGVNTAPQSTRQGWTRHGAGESGAGVCGERGAPVAGAKATNLQPERASTL